MQIKNILSILKSQKNVLNKNFSIENEFEKEDIALFCAKLFQEMEKQENKEIKTNKWKLATRKDMIENI